MWRKVKETLHKADILTLISTGTLAILLTKKSPRPSKKEESQNSGPQKRTGLKKNYLDLKQEHKKELKHPPTWKKKPKHENPLKSLLMSLNTLLPHSPLTALPWIISHR
jgi:hypothetical protein